MPWIFVPRLSGRAEDPQRRQIVRFHHGVAVRHERTNQSWAHAEDRDPMLFDELPEPIGPRIVGGAVIKCQRGAVGQSADELPRAHDPAQIGQPEENVVRADIELERDLFGYFDEKAAVYVDRAFGAAGRSGRVSNEERVFAVDRERGERRGGGLAPEKKGAAPAPPRAPPPRPPRPRRRGPPRRPPPPRGGGRRPPRRAAAGAGGAVPRAAPPPIAGAETAAAAAATALTADATPAAPSPPPPGPRGTTTKVWTDGTAATASSATCFIGTTLVLRRNSLATMSALAPASCKRVATAGAAYPLKIGRETAPSL